MAGPHRVSPTALPNYFLTSVKIAFDTPVAVHVAEVAQPREFLHNRDNRIFALKLISLVYWGNFYDHKTQTHSPIRAR